MACGRRFRRRRKSRTTSGHFCPSERVVRPTTGCPVPPEPRWRYVRAARVTRHWALICLNALGSSWTTSGLTRSGRRHVGGAGPCFLPQYVQRRYGRSAKR